MKRNVGYLQAGYPVLNIRSRIPAPGYPIPNHVALPTLDAAFTSVGNLLVTAGKKSICGQCRGNLSVKRSVNYLLTAG